jgi:hypothetical protein
MCLFQEYSQNPGRFHVLAVQRLGAPPASGPMIADLGLPSSSGVALQFVGMYPGVSAPHDASRSSIASASPHSLQQQWSSGT